MTQLNSHKEVTIAVALIEHGGKILLTQRNDPNPMWDKKWEFPGGKIEQGEDRETAVRREVFEETGLRLNSTTYLGCHEHDWHLSDYILNVHIHVFQAMTDGTDVLLELNKKSASVWVEPSHALEYDLLEANADILKKFLLS